VTGTRERLSFSNVPLLFLFLYSAFFWRISVSNNVAVDLFAMSPSEVKSVGRVLVDRASEEADYFDVAACGCQFIMEVIHY